MTGRRFGTVARRQQAAFRDTLPHLAKSPNDDKGLRNGHLLALGHEEENLYPTLRGPQGATQFFASRNIQWWNNGRSGDRRRDRRDQGPTRNLASSQVCCVNFLLPLAADPAALVAFLRCFDEDVVGIEPIRHEGNEALVEFEWVGWDRPLEGGAPSRGANQTSIDAFMVARTTTGTRAYLVEWKYCEEYRSPEYKGAGTSGDTRRSRYQSLYEAPGSAFNGTVPFDEWLYEPFYQIMRMMLLGDRMLVHRATADIAVDDARVVVVCPDANRDYLCVSPRAPFANRFSGVPDVESVVKASLRDPSRFAVVGQERIVDSLRAHPGLREWAEYHRVRYGW